MIHGEWGTGNWELGIGHEGTNRYNNNKNVQHDPRIGLYLYVCTKYRDSDPKKKKKRSEGQGRYAEIIVPIQASPNDVDDKL